MVDTFIRQVLFLLYAFVFRGPISLLICLIGRAGMLQTLFLIYPTDSSECLDFCPNITWLRNFLSARPTPAGLIMDGWRPMGMYLVIPNSSMELMRKNNRPLVKTIVHRMRRIQKFTRAKTIGLAGQLGPIFEKRHGIPMQPPFYSSTYGNIFSIQSAVSHLAATSKKQPWQVSVAVIGGGLLGEQLEKHLGSDGYQLSTLDVRYTRKGDVRLTDAEKANLQLHAADFVINLLPRGKDFMNCRLQHQIPQTATIIDFSRPPIPGESIPQKVVMGNRVQRSGMRFCMRLPGGWHRHELPACSMPSLLASLGRLPIKNMDDFRLAARQFQFQTALLDAPARPGNALGKTLGNFAATRSLVARIGEK